MAKKKKPKQSKYKAFWLVLLILIIGGLIGWSISDGSLSKPLLSLRIQAYSIGANLASLGMLIGLVGILVMFTMKSSRVAVFGFGMMVFGLIIQQMTHLS